MMQAKSKLCKPEESETKRERKKKKRKKKGQSWLCFGLLEDTKSQNHKESKIYMCMYICAVKGNQK